MFMIRSHILTTFIALNIYATITYAQIPISTAWNDYTCDDPVIEHVIGLPVMQRMKDIAVAGPTYYLGMVPDYSRYDHCIGVWWLLKEKAHVDQKQQLVGLLHDASHTVFSHLGDIVFGKGDGDKSYQDTIHLWFLSHYQDLLTFIKTQAITLESLDPDLAEYKALEQPLPDLCADRIEYNLATGVAFGKITKEEAHAIIQALEYHDGLWFFTDTQQAKKFAELPLFFTKNIWGGHENIFVYHCFKNIIVHAITTGLITRELMHFGSDTDIMNAIRKSNDPVIKEWLIKATEYHKHYTLVEYSNGDINTRPKCRAVDPYVYINETYNRLSGLDEDFAQQLHALQTWCRTGYGIRFTF